MTSKFWANSARFQASMKTFPYYTTNGFFKKDPRQNIHASHKQAEHLVAIHRLKNGLVVGKRFHFFPDRLEFLQKTAGILFGKLRTLEMPRGLVVILERQLFPELTADEQRVVAVLQRKNDLQINILSVQSGIAVGPLTALLFSLEMKGVVRTMAGGTYHLLM